MSEAKDLTEIRQQIQQRSAEQKLTQRSTMSVPEMRKLLGLKKTDSYWLVHKNLFKTQIIGGMMRIDLESFEKWYANQVKYKKVGGEEPGKELREKSYSFKEAANILGIHDCDLYDIWKNEKLEYITVDFVRRIPVDIFEKWYADQDVYRKVTHIPTAEELENDYICLQDAADLLGISREKLAKIARSENILNYLYKNTELQISYNFNMIAIVGRRPKQLGLLEILDAYIAHQKEVILKRSRFDLAHAEKRYHIVIGLIKAISILDEVVKTIRASKNKADAIANLVKEYNFTEEQATAIVELQLYRLTNTDVVVLEEEKANLERIMKLLEEILSSPEKLNLVIKEELRRIRREYFMPRLTEIRAEIEEIKIDNTMFIPDEDVIVALSHEGYIKRVSTRSYSKAEEETALKDTDYLIGLYKVNTRNTLLVFTNLGNYLYLPVYELPEAKWKELGKHISNIIPLAQNESIIGSMPVYNFNDEKYITIFTKNGMAKRTKLKDFAVQRYSKPICMMNLKDGDEVVSVDTTNKENTLIATHNGYGLWYSTEEIPVIGIRASGVKSINLKDDYVVSGYHFDNAEYITILTDKGTGKRLKLEELEKTTRAKRGSLLMKEIKSNPSKIINTFIENTKSEIVLITEKEQKTIKLTDIKVMDKQSNGSFIAKNKLLSSHIKVEMMEN